MLLLLLQECSLVTACKRCHGVLHGCCKAQLCCVGVVLLCWAHWGQAPTAACSARAQQLLLLGLRDELRLMLLLIQSFKGHWEGQPQHRQATAAGLLQLLHWKLATCCCGCCCSSCNCIGSWPSWQGTCNALPW